MQGLAGCRLGQAHHMCENVSSKVSPTSWRSCRFGFMEQQVRPKVVSKDIAVRVFSQRRGARNDKHTRPPQPVSEQALIMTRSLSGHRSDMTYGHIQQNLLPLRVSWTGSCGLANCDLRPRLPKVCVFGRVELSFRMVVALGAAVLARRTSSGMSLCVTRTQRMELYETVMVCRHISSACRAAACVASMHVQAHRPRP
ncbi:hypothetical protein BJ546DRAFT_117158 [Cryomyces antarcticus]